MYQRIIETKVDVTSYDELQEEYKKLIDEAKSQVSNAYAPYSGFHVGAAVLLENNEIFAANNQENSAYPSGLCAERVAMFFANAQYPDVPVKALAIAAHTRGKFLSEPVTPCGSCRQVLLETETRFDKSITILLYGENHVYKLDNVKQLLPLCFEKNSLDGE
ncbi:MAG: cytidine deaminase [Paludibacter sp.]|nr:cytidine deaminase [Paludibacter sp.]